MIKSPEISIIVPVYNAEKYLHRCIESILNQTFKDFELILINDGSTDNSNVICDKYKKADSRVNVINKKNEGVSASRNLGIDLSKGKYIMFADSDDWLELSMIENMYKQIKQSDIVICSNNIISIDKSETIILDNKFADNKKDIGKNLVYVINKMQHRCVWNKIYKSKIIKENDIKFLNDVMCGEDSIFNFMYFKHINSIKIISESYYNYNRIVDDSINLRYLPERVRYEHIMLKYFLELVDYYDLYNDNLNLINNYQFEGIFMSINSINHKECKINIFERYKFINKLINDFDFYSIKISSKNIVGFSTYSKLFILSKNPILLTIYSLILKKRLNKI